MIKILLPLLLILTLFSVSANCAEELKEEPSYWEQLKKKFEDAKSDDKELSKQAKEWIEEDIKKIGDWEYKVINIKHEDFDQLEQKLNELGNERWECIWMDKKEKEVALIFKRPKISYLQKVPTGQLFKMINSGQGE